MHAWTEGKWVPEKCSDYLRGCAICGPRPEYKPMTDAEFWELYRRTPATVRAPK